MGHFHHTRIFECWVLEEAHLCCILGLLLGLTTPRPPTECMFWNLLHYLPSAKQAGAKTLGPDWQSIGPAMALVTLV